MLTTCHPDVTSHTSILTSSMEHFGLVLILNSMLLSEQHGREIIGDRGQAGTSLHLRRRISGGMLIQHYYWEDQFHDEIYLKWKKQTQVTMWPISQNRRDNRQPSYMSTLTGQQWLRSTAKRKKRRVQKLQNLSKSAPDGKKMHKHGAGPRCFLNIEYKMMVDEGLDEPPSYTALRGRLTRVQYKNSSASVPIPVSLKRNLDVDMRMSGFEITISEVEEDIAGVKEDFSSLKTEINAFKTEVTGGCQQAKQLST
ncbi:hypothetical protein Bca52824_016345 [Brassica carinata]|uniref:Uncharacterized protein n=1 Tax=Brassica carinata TaxID=52824 RepID=A0A8X7W4X4_BRACI|nr:hypothetical protein Bca52824_016345 [Brassica carinata]